jgi:apolipoprotein N-acyltransferase
LKRLFPADRLRCLAAVAAGLVLAAAFPKLGVAGLAWVAPAAFLAAAFGTSGGRAFRIGWVAGMAHFLASLYWLLDIPVMKLAPIIGWLALSAFLALYSGLWTWLCWRLCPMPPAEAEDGWSLQLQRFAAIRWAQRALWTLTCAALWVALEMVRGRFLSGFPWNFLGASQMKMLSLIQIASVTGVYGVSFLVVWFSAALFSAGALLAAGGRWVRWAKLEVVPPLLATIGIVYWGLSSALRPAPPAATLKVALVQPSIPQRVIWDSDANSKRFAKLLELSERALATKPDLLVWPEGGVPGALFGSPENLEAITNLVGRHGVWLVLNANDFEPAPEARSADDYNVFNAAFLVNPQGKFVARYRKQHLVIFGEYIPLARWLPFLERWTGMGSFASGHGPVPFPMPALQCKASVLICFEDVFPHLARRHVDDDTDFLLNLTNNGWFGESAAQWQHAANAVFRAIENGRPLVRCANNGLTCWVDARGRVHETYFEGTQDIYGEGYKLAAVPLLRGKSSRTFYRTYGDVFGWVCVAVSGALVASSFLPRGRSVQL